MAGGQKVSASQCLCGELVTPHNKSPVSKLPCTISKPTTCRKLFDSEKKILNSTPSSTRVLRSQSVKKSTPNKNFQQINVTKPIK